MTDSHAAFVGSIPENYDRYLGPMFFEPYASDLASRVSGLKRGRVLELACGTGIVTRKLRDALPLTVDIVATDLNPAMIEFAKKKFRDGEHVRLSEADACDLPFDDHTFDLVACQFGFMFFPDKQAAFRQCARVLVPGSMLVFNVWDSIDHNDVAGISNAVINARFSDDPPTFYQTPFGFHDRTAIASMLTQAGFGPRTFETVDCVGVSPSALEAATGLIEGNPIRAEILQRDAGALSEVIRSLSQELASRFGDGQIQGKLRATVCMTRSSPEP
jgi:SAM-dependent methyltransferase